MKTRIRPLLENLEGRILLAASVLDPSFGNGGYVTNTVLPPAETVVAVEPWDGKSILAGDADNSVYRYNTNGTLDTSFGVGGVATIHVDAGYDFPSVIVTDPIKQQIYVVGISLVPDGKVDYYNYTVTRFHANGSLDATFGTGGTTTVAVGNKPWDNANAAALDSQGRLVVVGMSDSSKDVSENGYYGFYQDTILRFTTTGQLDTTFGSGGEVNGPLGYYTYDSWGLVTTHPDNSITVEGQDNSQSGVIATYSAAGKLKSRYVIQPPANPYDTSQSIALGKVAFLPNGDLLSSTPLADAPNGDDAVAVVRYTPSGVVDTTYGTGGVTTTDLTTALGYPTGSTALDDLEAATIDPSGGLVLGGDFEPYTLVNGKRVFGPNQELLVRFTPAGALDPSFGNGGTVLASLGSYGASAITSLTTQPDGNILAVGWSNATNEFDASSSSVVTMARYWNDSSETIESVASPTKMHAVKAHRPAHPRPIRAFSRAQGRPNASGR